MCLTGRKSSAFLQMVTKNDKYKRRVAAFPVISLFLRGTSNLEGVRYGHNLMAKVCWHTATYGMLVSCFSEDHLCIMKFLVCVLYKRLALSAVDMALSSEVTAQVSKRN